MSWTKWTAAIHVTTGMNGEPLTPTEKLVYLLLANYFNDREGWAFPSVDTLAEQAQLKRRHCQTVLARLEAKGRILRIPDMHARWGQRQNLYDVVLNDKPESDADRAENDAPPHAVEHIPPCGIPHPPPAVECTPPCAPVRPPDAAERIGPMRAAAPKQVEELEKEPKSEQEGELAASPPRISTFARYSDSWRGRPRATGHNESETEPARLETTHRPLGPITHSQRQRLRFEYDRGKQALAERLDPRSAQRGFRLATERLGGFDVWLAKRQGIGS